VVGHNVEYTITYSQIDRQRIIGQKRTELTIGDMSNALLTLRLQFHTHIWNTKDIWMFVATIR
jgi:hypothetical protein